MLLDKKDRLLCSSCIEKRKEKIQYIVEEIRLAFVETLPNIEWMDLETRQQAQIKANMIIGILN